MCVQVTFKAHDGAVLAMQLFQVNQGSPDPGPLRLITSGPPRQVHTLSCLLPLLNYKYLHASECLQVSPFMHEPHPAEVLQCCSAQRLHGMCPQVGKGCFLALMSRLRKMDQSSNVLFI